ncbi:hypothetical protein [Cycloclasticus pugetii]|uniref:hypothetical protein n=1 Tax=Cycloclasticus pugetii TaxID=34068 RepID=UPI003A8CB6A2
MANIDYPAELPTPQRSGYAIQHTSPFMRTDMATGRARQRRTFTSVPSTVELQWLLTNAQAQIFEAWFAYDITDGADWFNLALTTPVGRLEFYECRFAAMYDGPALVGLDHWRYTAKVEIRKRPLLPKDWYLIGREFVLGADIIDQAINREWPEA